MPPAPPLVENPGLGRQFGRFLAVGATAALVNIASRAALSQALPFDAAILLAYLLGMATAFLLNRRYVFDARRGRVAPQLLRFTLVNMLALAQVWLVTQAMLLWVLPALGWGWNAPLVAHATGVASPVFTSFLAHRFWSFRRPQ